MSDKKKKEKKTREIIVPTKEIDQIKAIIHVALTRILSGKTKKTYQQELKLISETIQKYIRISYMPIEEHNKQMVIQIFGYINCFKDLKKNVKGRTDKDKGFCEALDKVIAEFESLINRKK